MVHTDTFHSNEEVSNTKSSERALQSARNSDERRCTFSNRDEKDESSAHASDLLKKTKDTTRVQPETTIEGRTNHKVEKLEQEPSKE